MPSRELLLIPGPTPVPDLVLQAIARQPIGHRSKEFSQVLRTVVDDLQWLGDTSHDVFVLTASGTGAMESAIANTVNAEDKVLSLVSGVFGERFAKLAEAYGAAVERISVAHGEAISVELVRKRLMEDKQKSFKAVTMTHNETSTGVINNLEEIGQVVAQHGALFIVDAVTSFGACPVPISTWHIDVLVAGSQKALMLPPGLSLAFVSQKARDAESRCRNRRYYFDFARQRRSMESDTTPFTPNIALVLALRASLSMIKNEGKEAVFARHEKMKTILRGGVQELGVKLLAKDECASPTVTAILPPEDVTVDAIRQMLKKRFQISVADGQDALKGKIFRISHMGYVFERDMMTVLAALEKVLKNLRKTDSEV